MLRIGSIGSALANNFCIETKNRDRQFRSIYSQLALAEQLACPEKICDWQTIISNQVATCILRHLSTIFASPDFPWIRFAHLLLIWSRNNSV